MTTAQVVLVFIWAASLIFALTNGLHDAGAVVATLVASRAASPRQAVTLSALASMAGAVLGGQAVAQTISSLIRVPVTDDRLLPLLLAAVLGAVTWNFLTWHLGLPSSSTHALVGGCVGSSLIMKGPSGIQWLSGGPGTGSSASQGIAGIFIALLISTLIGFFVAFILEKIGKYLFARARYSLNHWLNRSQWVLMAMLSFSHGSNDAQKIAGLLILAGLASGQATPNAWTYLAWSGFAIFLGTMFGSWPIIRTVSREIFNIRPVNGFNAQLAAAGSSLAATSIGVPVSTSHIVIGSVMGSGAAVRYKSVNWQIAKGIVAAWLITFPASAMIAASLASLLRLVW